jgi:hypothetical protein
VGLAAITGLYVSDKVASRIFLSKRAILDAQTAKGNMWGSEW